VRLTWSAAKPAPAGVRKKRIKYGLESALWSQERKPDSHIRTLRLRR
jgi:hypothetical protein